MPEAVSIVTGNQTASAINPAADTTADGDNTIARGIQAVAGIGPTTLSSGIPQYRTGVDHPMQIPLIRPTSTPTVYPLRSNARECQVLSSKSARSLIRLRRTAAGPGKYGIGSSWKPNVTTSHRPSNKIAAVKIGHMCPIHERTGVQNRWAIARTIDTATISQMNRV